MRARVCVFDLLPFFLLLVCVCVCARVRVCVCVCVCVRAFLSRVLDVFGGARWNFCT